MLAQEAEHEARQPGSGTSNGMDVDKKEGEEAGEEMSVREKERLELEGLIDPELKKDVGSNPTGMYQCVALSSLPPGR